jgi:DNA repair protein RadD
MLRPYQQKAHDAIIDFIRRLKEPCLIEAATGAGKSHIIAALAKTIHHLSDGKRILCLAPSGELVEQNYKKFLLTGNKASIFSASVGQKSIRYPVVFGTPKTVLNSIHKFIIGQYAAVIIDEAHGITPTIMEILSKIKQHNANLRIIGMSATPYRLGTGYIFEQWEDGRQVEEAESPFFKRLVDKITAPELISLGYLVPPTVGATDEHYDTLGMQLNPRGQFNANDIDRAYHGAGRKTSKIISNVVESSRDRRGVIIYAATVKHAQECMQSLPRELSAIITADTAKRERKKILSDFLNEKIKYLVNVGVLTTGFDAPHVDVIALLRATESVSLLQQIIGRGLRTCEGKVDCLVLDYAENIERHCPDGDIFDPEIKVRTKADTESKEFECPTCGFMNTFKLRKNEEGFLVNDNGYFCDLDGNPIETDWGPMPSHYGRRCQGTAPIQGLLVQCTHRWTDKTCESCGASNDIAARYCTTCRAEIVDPNEKLRLEFTAFKRDPTQTQTDYVVDWVAVPTVTQRGYNAWRINVTTEYRKFEFWVMKEPRWGKGISDRNKFLALKGEKPKTITYRKDAQTKFYEVLAYNREADEAPRGHKDIRRHKLPGSVPA